jgi:predicted nucleic acid-binding protein
LTFDTGGLIAYERGDQRMRAMVRNALAEERTICVPAVALAEAWRGENASRLAGLLDAAQIEPLSDKLARRAGELLARTGTGNTIDAIVAVSAAQRSDIVVTSDPDDLQRFADDLPVISIVSA